MNKCRLLIPVLLLFITINAIAQEDVPDYLRNPTLPPFTLLGMDSMKITRADIGNKKTLIMLFNPGCGYCRVQTDSLVGNIDKLGDVEIVMVSFEPFESLRAFYNEFKLANYHNIKLGRDIRYFFTPYFEPTGVPFLALYDEKGRFITKFGGGVPIPTLLKAYEGKNTGSKD